MRACAVDLGDTRTGVAFSDINRTIVGETEVIKEKNLKKLAHTLAEMFAEKGVACVAVGLPVNMDGTRGPRVESRVVRGAPRRGLGIAGYSD